jgi:hypothetical protein
VASGSYLQPLVRAPLERRQVDQWPIAESGLSVRVINCLQTAGVRAVGQLRDWSEKDLMALRNFGATSREDVRRFFQWTKRLECPNGRIFSFRSLLREFLNLQELMVVEQRFGLNDPRFRPNHKRPTLQRIASMRLGVTRERVRQIEELAVARLRSRLCRAVMEQQEILWHNRIQERGCVVTCTEVAEWVNDPLLGGYEPWGVLLLLSEITSRIRVRYNYFTTLPQLVVDDAQRLILKLLNASRRPVAFENIVSKVSRELNSLNGQHPRVVKVLLENHPEISGTLDRRYFADSVGAPLVLASLLQECDQPVHFHALTRLYNSAMSPQSRKGTGYILRVLTLMPQAERTSCAIYALKTRQRFSVGISE